MSAPLGINPDLSNWQPTLTPSDIALIFDPLKAALGNSANDMEYWCQLPTKVKPMPIETMPEGTMIPPIEVEYPDGRARRDDNGLPWIMMGERLAVQKDADGYTL